MGKWISNHPTITSRIAAVAIGIVAWSGHEATLSLTFGFLPLVLVQATRRSAYLVAGAYYLGSSWSLVPGVNVFFGPNDHLLKGLALWVSASGLLAAPWGLFHFQRASARIWSTLFALGATSLPPLGLIGWASPLSSAGILFPGAGWLGIIAVLLLPSLVIHRPYWGLAILGALIALANAVYPGDPPPPAAWQAVDTAFGRTELDLSDPIREFQNAEWIQQKALSTNASVIVFPETAVPQWNAATEEFWDPTLEALAASGKTLVFGTTIPISGSSQRLNSVVLRGANRPATFVQRVPVPISMWNPFSQRGFPLRLSGPGSIRVGRERAAVLICYELLLTWPVLSVSLERPTILVGVANDYWASQTTIPAVQRAALSTWARLFGLPKLLAVNT